MNKLRWFRQPISMSMYLWLVLPLLRIYHLLDDKSMYVSSGREIKRRLVSNSQTKMVFSLSIHTSTISLVAKIIVLPVNGVLLVKRYPYDVNGQGKYTYNLWGLLPPSTHTVVVSSM